MKTIVLVFCLALGSLLNVGCLSLSKADRDEFKAEIVAVVAEKVTAKVSEDVGNLVTKATTKLGIPPEIAAAIKDLAVKESTDAAKSLVEKTVGPAVEKLASSASSAAGSKTGKGVLGALWGVAQIVLGAGFGSPKV